MTYRDLVKLKDDLVKEFLFLDKQIPRRYHFNNPSNNFFKKEHQANTWEFINGIGVGYSREFGYKLTVYTEGSISVRAVSEYLGLRPELIKVEEIGPITVLGVGSSISSEKGATGTLGCYVKDESCEYLLSNFHVLSNFGTRSIGEKILLPSRKMGGRSPDDIHGTLSNYVAVNFLPAINELDCAIAILNNGKVPIKSPVIDKSIMLKEEGMVNLEVSKIGAATGKTVGIITDLNASIKVDYGNGFANKHIAHFENQIVVKPFNEPKFAKMGDSGSVLVDNKFSRPIGLIFAGSSEGYAFANDFNKVLSSLSVTLL